MGSGDLNMKKSWHPQRSGNVAATQRAEAEALAERKKLQQRLQEIEEERRREEIQKALEAAGGKPRPQRVEWMYQGPSDHPGGDAAENEAYLLGKRRIDKLLQDNELKQLSKQGAQDGASNVPASGAGATNARDLAAKLREDPLLAIKRKEQEAYQAMMNDPIKRRQLLKSMGIDDAKLKEEKRSSRHHREGRHRSHRHEGDRDGERHSRRRRSRERSRSRSPRRYYDSEDDRRRSRRDSRERRRDRSESSESRDRRDRRDRDRKDGRSDRYGGDRRDRSISRSPPRRRDYSPDRDRDRRRRGSPRRDSPARDTRRRDDHSPDDRDRDRRGRNSPSPRHPDSDTYRNGNHRSRRDRSRDCCPPPQSKSSDEEERARKLAAMQAAASDLDADRQRRLAMIEEQERAEREKEEKLREQSRKYGGDLGFMSRLHSRAAELKVADRVGKR